MSCRYIKSKGVVDIFKLCNKASGNKKSVFLAVYFSVSYVKGNRIAIPCYISDIFI